MDQSEPLEAGIEEKPKVDSGLLSDKDPAEVAAMLINQFSQRYKEQIYGLTTGQSRRLCIALCTYPLENEHVMEFDNHLQQVYQLGCRLMEAKFLLISDAFTQKMKEENIQQKENENG